MSLSKPPPAAEHQQPARRILIVDGDETVALVTQRGLQAILGASAESVEVVSPSVAWRRCEQGEVDLVVIEPGPGNVAGDALLRRLRAQLPDLPVIVLTAHDTPRLRAEMRALGVRRYLAKPALLQELERDIRDALARQ